MALDHGTLNIPLAKRGDIDSQLDQYKAAQDRAARSLRRANADKNKSDKATAVELLAGISDERLAALSVKCNSTPAQVIRHLRSQCHWQPSFVIRLLAA
ncbi:MAG: hypothetical protein M9937_26395 [Chelatococcus sp.]|uniref:hypothetical protein n=1 Tax=Chelatococcus sp. TaxID=1953771 RepID=UPI0026209A82|nr:hypothetical protein [Chelatococcus sp.]MCO5079203.1 hypothetical protein [Chelatococcus sp.]